MSDSTMHAGNVSATAANECTQPAQSSGTVYFFQSRSSTRRTVSAPPPSSCSTRGKHAFDCTNLGNASIESA
eukprot:6162036-Prymnesium_polylepis.2